MSRPWLADQPEQEAMVPVSIRAVLPADHPAIVILAMVAELDLSAFVEAYRADGLGHPPYDPAMMVALILYGMAQGKTTSKEIADLCIGDLGARLITRDAHPHRRTIANFVSAHGPALQALLPQTLAIAHADGELDLSFLAGDGTKVAANAAMGANVDEASLTEQILTLEQQLGEAEKQWLELVGRHEAPASLFDHITGGESSGGEGDYLPPRPAGGSCAEVEAYKQMCRLRVKLRRRQAALAYLREHPNNDLREWQQRLTGDLTRVAERRQALDQALATAQAAHTRRLEIEAYGSRLGGRRPDGVEDYARVKQARKSLATAIARAEKTAAARPTTTKVNTTDPTSRLMPRKGGGYDQLHNAQALTTRKQLIISVGLHPNSNDKQALVQLVLGGRANLDAAAITDPMGTVAFDSGYASEDNFTTELPVKNLLVAVEKEARQTGRLADGTSTAAPAWQDMMTRLDEETNRALYRQRGATVEPVFAQLFNRFGRTLFSRGPDALTELHLWAITHNLLKIVRWRARKAAATKATTKPRPG